MLELDIAAERLPLAQPFAISRGRKTEAHVVVARLSDGNHHGWGECVPYARYGESVEGIVAALAGVRAALHEAITPAELATYLPAGAARNALDCALWDLRAKQAGRRVHELLGLPAPEPVTTAFTISLDTSERMREAARAAADRPLLKVKLGTADDRERIAAVRAAAPEARLIVDANEGWRPENLAQHIEACERAAVELIEQPLPADDDDALGDVRTDVALCADESAHGLSSLDRLEGKYSAINVKLDKTGGLTEALALVEAAQSRGLAIFVGCMVASSLAIAPALLVTRTARWVDLDGPLWLKADRSYGLVYDAESRVHPASPALWG
jgi:L-alanine-DL-glutamate epimerase-like enolase superfamily enzyme